MLNLHNISKHYQTGDLIQNALDGVDLSFRDSEFVAILGPSGSGKTTMLNIIGGLDRYDSGDLIIDGISTKKYSDRDWDSYRNHSVGYVFQNYNLIPHQSILANVELALTISGIGRTERKARALAALRQVGLDDQAHKRPNQMSGGQMQRVAIARALVNDPKILLADEPTGALDSQTSLQVMDLLKEVAQDRLVIMVTHNAELASQYATRIVGLTDGRIVSDTNPPDTMPVADQDVRHENMGFARMNFATALALSFNNLRTKLARTLLTAFAGSIGIIGIALILSLSNGVNTYITDIQRETMTSYPISITATAFDLSGIMSAGAVEMMPGQAHGTDGVYANTALIRMASSFTSSLTENNLTAFKRWLDDEDCPIHNYVGENGIVYSYNIDFTVFTYDPDGVFINTDGVIVNPMETAMSQSSAMTSLMNSNSTYSSATSGFEQMLAGNEDSLVSDAVKDSYELLYGKWPENYDEVVLVLNQFNEINVLQLYELGFLPSSEYEYVYSSYMSGESFEVQASSWSYEDACAQTFSLVPACDMYVKQDDGTFKLAEDVEEIEAIAKEGIQLTIVGVIRPVEDAANATLSGAIAYTQALSDYIIAYINASDVVLAQQENPDINILNGQTFESQSSADTSTASSLIGALTSTKNGSYEDNMSAFGVVNLDTPTSINIYVETFEAKDAVSDYIEEYNASVSEEYQITYTDYIGLLLSSVTTIIDVIGYVLIAFVSVSLVVSSIMIGIITYISVLERTKEIGILRAIGASKRNISTVFNAETFIIGACSGIIGVGVSVLLLIPANILIHFIAKTDSVNAILPWQAAIFFIFLSIVLTIIGGLIPSGKAARMDPVSALRTE